MRLSKNDIENFPRFCFTESKFFVVDSLCSSLMKKYLLSEKLSKINSKRF